MFDNKSGILWQRSAMVKWSSSYFKWVSKMKCNGKGVYDYLLVKMIIIIKKIASNTIQIWQFLKNDNSTMLKVTFL